MTEKPLHVRVAEALGCKVKHDFGRWLCECKPPKGEFDHPHAAHRVHVDCCHSYEGLDCDHYELARYDTDWSATGGLVERLGIAIWPQTHGWAAELRFEHRALGDTPLIAACNLLLALKEAGKLDRAE